MLFTFEEITKEEPILIRQYKDEIRSIIADHGLGDEVSGVAHIGPKLGLSGPQVRKVVHHLRVHESCPICSNSKGYWWAQDAEEMDSTIMHSEQRIRSIQEYINELEQVRESLRRREVDNSMEQSTFL